jgi:conjugative transfer signal peptidase TraF
MTAAAPRTVLAVTAAAVAAAAFTASVGRPTKLLWNASASVPIGLYAVRPAAGALHIAELVVVAPPEPLAGFLADRGYLPEGVPLLKHVLALPGQTVCRSADTITIDGAAVGQARKRDRRGRVLPDWQGCRRIAPGEVFLMNRGSADSLDGRYFGALPTAAVAGRADPLWVHDKD